MRGIWNEWSAKSHAEFDEEESCHIVRRTPKSTTRNIANVKCDC